jgi:hypothetical protein
MERGQVPRTWLCTAFEMPMIARGEVLGLLIFSADDQLPAHCEKVTWRVDMEERN